MNKMPKPDRDDPPGKDQVEDIASDDPHKVEKLVMIGQKNIDPNEGTE